ncbi:hypothetical protein MHYP_G00285090 [Metynnis hypsauchen]
MFLNEPVLDISFRVSYEGRSYMLYASTGSMRCFECGDVGHKRLICPHRARVSEESEPGTSGGEGRQVSVEQSAGPGEGTEERPAAAAAADISVSDSVSEVGAHGVDTERLDGSRAPSEAHEGEGGSETAPSAQVEAVSTGDAAVGESGVSVDMPVTQEEEEEEEGFSDFSDIASQAGEDHKRFLRRDFWKPTVIGTMRWSGVCGGMESMHSVTGPISVQGVAVFFSRRLGIGHLHVITELTFKSIRLRFQRAGITKLGDLRFDEDWKSGEVLRAATGIMSVRLLQRIVGGVASSLPTFLKKALQHHSAGDQETFPSLPIAAEMGDHQEEEGALLSFRTPQLAGFAEVSKKALYSICVKVLHRNSLDGLKESRWLGFVGTSFFSARQLEVPVQASNREARWRSAVEDCTRGRGH